MLLRVFVTSDFLSDCIGSSWDVSMHMFRWRSEITMMAFMGVGYVRGTGVGCSNEDTRFLCGPSVGSSDRGS
jgi:hypothetical protein